MFIALLLKLLTTAYLLKVDWPQVPGYNFGDGPAYLHTAKAIATHGTYSLYNSPEGDPLPYAGRLPGYDVVLAPLFLVFQEARTVAVVAIILQLLLAGISLYYLYRLMLKLVPHGWIPAILLWLYAVNVFTGMYDIKSVTESFSISALVIGLALTLDFRNKKELLVGSLLLLWAYMLRPPVLPICMLGWIYPMVSRRQLSYAWTFAPLLLFTLLWTTRNYVQFERLIPLTSDLHGGYQFQPWQLSLFSMIGAWGGDISWWREDADIRFFLYDLRVPPQGACEDAMTLLPPYILTSTYNQDSLCALRDSISKIIGGNQALAAPAIAQMKRFEQAFKTEKPMAFHINARIRLLSAFMSQNGAQYLYRVPFHRLVHYEKVINLTYRMLFWIVMSLAFIGAFLALFRGPLEARILALSFFFILLVFPLVLRRIEYRYIIHFFPLAVVLAAVWMDFLMAAFRLRKGRQPLLQ